MARATREIKRRIKSIKSTGKITKAMELVSAVKMRKAVDHMLSSRAYAHLAWQIVTDLAKRVNVNYHELLIERPVKKVAIVLVASNRGLCGSFNSQIVASAYKHSLDLGKEGKDKPEIEFILLGKKARDIVSKYKKQAVAEFEKPDVTLKVEEIFSLSKMIIGGYMEGKYDRVALAYTDYVSSLKQTPRIKQLLPIPKEEDVVLGSVGEWESFSKTESMDMGEYIFEPSPEKVLENILPRLIETQIYQAVLESDASEHSARMMAMKNATEAAHDLIDDLTLAFNQARQAGITQEIAEISGTKAAMNNDN